MEGLIADEQPAVASLLAATGEVHSKGMQSYMTMMAVRLIEMRRVLKETGSIYLHCDPTASHYLKALMDAVFVRGGGSFRNEIVWAYAGGGVPRNDFPRKHDIILRYARGRRGRSIATRCACRTTATTRQRCSLARAHALRARPTSPTHAEDRRGLVAWDFTPLRKSRIGYPTQKAARATGANHRGIEQ